MGYNVEETIGEEVIDVEVEEGGPGNEDFLWTLKRYCYRLQISLKAHL